MHIHIRRGRDRADAPPRQIQLTSLPLFHLAVQRNTVSVNVLGYHLSITVAGDSPAPAALGDPRRGGERVSA